MTCNHSWLRLPVTDTTVIYRCETCEEQHRLAWLTMTGSVSEADKSVTGSYGGMVRGEYYEGPGKFPWSLTLGGRMEQVRKTGLLTHTEDPREEDDE